MLATRLDIALDRGLVTLPAQGRIAVFGAREGDDLAALPSDRTEVITGHYPDFAAFRDAPGARIAPEGRYALAVVVVPRARAEAERRIAAARAVTDGPIVVDGAKTDGVEPLLRSIRARAEVGDVLSKAHGKIFVVEGGDFGDWQHRPHEADGFLTVPGGFSADGIDPGSAALARSLPARLGPHVVDLGAGWGYLSAAALEREGVERIDLVEADHASLEAARTNITDGRARFHWADARTFRPETPADDIVCNPPFHTGRSADTALGQAFLRQAAAILAPRGTLWLVANRHLPYERTLQGLFRDVRTIDLTEGYKILAASHPLKKPGR